MKPLLDFVVCCCGTSPQPSEPPASEEPRWLVLTSAPIRRPVRCHRRRSSAAEWRPSLSAIHEEKFSPERDRRTIGAGTERMLRRNFSSPAGAGGGGARSSHDGDRYRKSDRPMVIPAFAPTLWF